MRLASVDCEDAVDFVREVYESRSHDGSSVEHPLAVARLLRDDGQQAKLVLAGLLHDVLEDTDVSAAELRERFGPEVTELVQALTQDDSIAAHRARKSALRRQVLEYGPDAATVALADKAVKLEGLTERPKERRLEHYRETLRGIEERYGQSRLSELLRRRLGAIAGNTVCRRGRSEAQ